MNGLGDLAGGVLRGNRGNGSVYTYGKDWVPRNTGTRHSRSGNFFHSGNVFGGGEIAGGVGQDIVFAQRQGGHKTVKSIFHFDLADCFQAGGGGIF